MSAIISIVDGGFSTQLSRHVGDKIDGDPLWTARFLATHPEAVLATHLDFLRAGSDIILTNTYQASVEGYAEHLGMTESESLHLIHKAVELADEAVRIYMEERGTMDSTGSKDWRPLIAGSCGPYGASLHDGSEYTGSYASTVTKSFLREWHRPRIEALINSGVDLLALETIPCAIEAEALVELLKEYPSTKAWMSFSCRTDGKRIVDGSDFRRTAIASYRSAIPGQLVAVGINCIAPRLAASFFQGINQGEQSVPLVLYPNSGETYTVAEGWRKYGNEPQLENFIQEWLDLGVRYVGGCCRTYAKDVTKIKAEVEEWLEKKKRDPQCC
ncbi:homocysteine S-methyltransferase 2 [Fopius arisanus]|uniref:Homocysteine S-methyltransferase 2 n=1 Tax=Fopius arisanus TaxID=64838 RepID=A0A0C9QPL2_9HYME|nr:PREDICTED: homocysteine S-methyltransferase 2-like [Fopius arisanus]